MTEVRAPEQPVTKTEQPKQENRPERTSLGAGVQKLLERIHLRQGQGDTPRDVLRSIAEGDKPWSPQGISHLLRRPHRENASAANPGELTPKELKKLSFDFDTYHRKNSPIEGVFYPDAAENKDAHELQAKQQEALAKCKTLIETYIEKDDINSDQALATKKLKGLVDTFGADYGFTDRQKNMTKDLVDAYYNHRQEGIALRAKYQNDRELVRHLSGLAISDNAPFDVKVGPWGLEITTDNDMVNNAIYRGETPSTDFCAGGAADITAIPPYIILNKDFSDKNTLAHERQHVRYALNKQVLKRYNQDVSRSRNSEQAGQPNTIEEVYERQFQRERNTALDRAKDEIFAYSFNSDHFPTELFFGRDGNPYDYLKNQREYGAQHGDPRYRAKAQKVFVDEYEAMVTSAAADFKRLMDVGGYSKQEAVALLTDKPVADWSETTKGLLEMRKNAVANRYGKPLHTRRLLPKHFRTPRPAQPETAAVANVVDVVITAEDKQPTWYKERELVTEKQNTEKTAFQIGEAEIATNGVLTLLSQVLYEKTRTDAEQYIRKFKDNGLKHYFSLLDRATLELGNRRQDIFPPEQTLKETGNQVLVLLAELLKKLLQA